MIRAIIGPYVKTGETLELDIEEWFDNVSIHEINEFAGHNWNTGANRIMSCREMVTTMSILSFFSKRNPDVKALKERLIQDSEEHCSISPDAEFQIPGIKANDHDIGVWINSKRPGLIEQARDYERTYQKFVGGAAQIAMTAIVVPELIG